MGSKTERRRIKADFNDTLTPGENLLLWRRRKEWTQLQAAEYFGVSLFCYKLAEYDRPTKFNYREFKLGQLRPNEICLLYRKRSGKTQTEISKLVGCGKYWLLLQETGKVSCNRLLRFWESN